MTKSGSVPVPVAPQPAAKAADPAAQASVTASPAAAASPNSGTASTWVAYSAQVQSTAKWTVGALAAVAAVVFGAGPIVARPTLDPRDDLVQLLLAGILGIAGLAGVAALIAAAAAVLMPHAVTLDDLPASLAARVDASPHEHFPARLGVKSVAEFRRALLAVSLAAATAETDTAALTRQVEAAKARGDAAQTALLEARLAVYEANLPKLRQRRAQAEECRDVLLERGAYVLVSEAWARHRNPIVAGTALAIVGGIGFQLALASPGADDDAAAGSGTAFSPVVTTMQKVPGLGGDALWTALSLDACESNTDEVTVLLTGGAGTLDDPYKVQTLPIGTCESTSFTVVSEVAIVDVTEPPQVTITYGPAPSVLSPP